MCHALMLALSFRYGQTQQINLNESGVHQMTNGLGLNQILFVQDYYLLDMFELEKKN